MKIVPLVVYVDDRRKPVGTAEIAEDGTVSFTIEDVEIAKAIGDVGELSIIPKGSNRLDMCWSCAMGKCKVAEGDNVCYCCVNNHKI